MIEFYVRMKDLMSSGLAKIAQNSKKSFGTVDKEIDNLTKKMHSLANSFDVADRKANGSNGFLNRLGSKLKGIGVGTALAGVLSVAALSGFAKDSIGKAIQHERTKQTFQVLTGNRGIGNALASQLNTLQQDTVLGPEVFKNAQTMLGFGITAEKVIPTLKMLGDVSMGDAERLQSLTLAFSQVQAAGRLTGQDLLQFINAGFNPLNQISKDTGKSIADLKKEMEKGGVSAAMVSTAFEHATGNGGLFNNMLNKMSETTSGKMAQLDGAFESLKISIGERMKPAVNSFVGGLTTIVGKVKSWFDIPIEKKLTDEIIQIKTLTAQLSSANITHERQLQLLNQLEQINPKILEGIDKQALSYDKLRENVERVTGALRDNIKLEVLKEKITPSILKYEGLLNTREGRIYDLMQDVTTNFPSIANNTSLTDEQKITAASVRANQLEELWYKSHEDKRGRTLSPISNLSTTLETGAYYVNNLGKMISTLEPEYNKGMKDIADQKAAVDKVLGIGSMVTAAGVNNGSAAGATTGSTAAGKDVVSGITGGGPRVININGVKFADKIELHAGSGDQVMNDFEKKMKELFLRTLNSGAAVQ